MGRPIDPKIKNAVIALNALGITTSAACEGQNVEHIKLYYLPSYCPELNPDEFLNQDVKSHLGKKSTKSSYTLLSQQQSAGF